MPYQIILRNHNEKEQICFVMPTAENDEYTDKLMEWIKLIHHAWCIEKVNGSLESIHVIGYRVAHNQFHLRRLRRVGELL